MVVVNIWETAGSKQKRTNAAHSTIQSIHVDILCTGTILVNGRLLIGLPRTVLDHSLYKRTLEIAISNCWTQIIEGIALHIRLMDSCMISTMIPRNQID
jgi:hypothetical protein